MNNGFIEIHTHGAINIDVNSASEEELIKLSKFFEEHGCKAWVPTVMTDKLENMMQACKRIASAKKSQTEGARILGIHLEGPFLSPDFKGAMPLEMLREGDCSLVEEFQKVSDGNIIRMTVAPEMKGVTEVIKQFANDFNISLGHSNATYELGMKAFELGATSVTHCCNAMRLFHQHEPGLLGAAIDSDCMIEVIGDGLHLVPGTVRILIKSKGIKNVAVITDSMSAAGLGDGNFILGGNKVIVKNGDARLVENDVRAGSTLTMDRAFSNIKKFTGLSDEQVMPMFCENQERLLKIKV